MYYLNHCVNICVHKKILIDFSGISSGGHSPRPHFIFLQNTMSYSRSTQNAEFWLNFWKKKKNSCGGILLKPNPRRTLPPPHFKMKLTPLDLVQIRKVCQQCGSIDNSLTLIWKIIILWGSLHKNFLNFNHWHWEKFLMYTYNTIIIDGLQWVATGGGAIKKMYIFLSDV